jgi:hypothetical protein
MFNDFLESNQEIYPDNTTKEYFTGARYRHNKSISI